MDAATKLLDWYDRNHRSLPWRGTRNPYRIWVAEVMLQQTRVETVIPYYRRFVERFPTVAHLAGADEAAVLAAWSGLGYYRRARNLLRAARVIVAAGGFPRRARGLQQLPGIGSYTAAAIASIAFGERTPVLDGNVIRVLARRLAAGDDPRRAAARRRLADAALELLAPDRPGDSNQALMELGATVCTPRRPACPACPLEADCVAARQGRAEDYPLARPAPRPAKVTGVVAVVRREERLLLFQRPADGGLLAGTWELPWVCAEGCRAEDALSERYGGRWRLRAALGRIRHSITSRRFDLAVREARHEAGALGASQEAAWFSWEEIRELPISAMVVKVGDCVENGGRSA